MKNLYKVLNIFALAAVIALLGGCFSDWTNNTGTIAINLGGNSGGNRSVQWPPNDDMKKDIKYKITFSGSSGTILIDAEGGTTIKTTLAAGIWDIEIEAFLNMELYAKGSDAAEVKAGETVYKEIMLYYAGEPVVVEHVHQWGEWTRTKDPTDTEDGEKTRTCATCGETETNAIAAFNHTHEWGEWSVTTPATCTDKGEETRICSLNATHYETRPIDALGHDWSKWTQTKAPTETEEGEETRICANDATHPETRTIAELGHTHNWGNWSVTTPATCTAKGEEKRVCKLNGDHYETSDIDLLGHNYDVWTQTIDPTCTTAGEDTRICSNDAAHKETRTGAAALEHDEGAWHTTLAATCTAKGTKELRCTRDNAVLDDDTIDELGHDEGVWHTTLNPTCTVAGTKQLRCTRDSVVLADDIIDALGHDEGEWHTTLNPTCTVAGTKQLRCTIDNAVLETETIDALGHNYAWTPTLQGIETKICTHDAAHTAETRLNIAMVSVPGGSFQMGQNLGTGGGSSTTPVHTVTLTGFSMGKYEVTQAQYEMVMGSNPSDFSSDPESEEVQGNRPVEKVSWYDAIKFCNKLSMLEELNPVYSISGKTDPDEWGGVPSNNNSTWNAVVMVSGANGYRLPTEAQWEYAAKGGNPTAAGWVGYTYSGSDTVGDVGWYTDNSSSKTHEVGKKLPNGLGIYDMSGNVFEWCWDWNGDYTSAAQTDPVGATSGSNRVVRGGSWGYDGQNLRSAYRLSGTPSNRYSDFGFRLVRP